MKHTVLLIQLLLTLLILAFVQDNLLKTVMVLATWWLTFGTFSKREWIAFFGINLLFVVSDIGAIHNGFFQFNHPSLFGLPAWEYFMWGFYLLHLHRMVPPRVPKKLDFKILLFALVFSQLFAIVADRQLLLILTSGILGISLFFYHESDDLIFCAYLMLMGAAVEYVGLSYDLWHYPERDYRSAVIQFVVMWGAAGLYSRHLLSGWLQEKKTRISVYRDRYEALHPSLQTLFTDAIAYTKQNKREEALDVFRRIEALAVRDSHALTYQFYLEYSRLCVETGNLRKAIELTRDAIPFAVSNRERASLYLQQCRVYRMMILMQNARAALGQAFEELGLLPPRNSVFATLRAVLRYLVDLLRKRSPQEASEGSARETLELTVALYEEAGLSAYYYVEYHPLLQCTLRAWRPAFLLGDSVEMINWLGGSACVWSILGWRARAEKLFERAKQMQRRLSRPTADAKMQLWTGLFLTYNDQSAAAAEVFDQTLRESRDTLSAYDLHLIATTLSCNYLVRGHMRKAEEAILFQTSTYIPSGGYFSSAHAYVDYYRIPALAFLGDREEALRLLKKSDVVFNRIDEEKWQLTLFIGGLLMYYYATLNSSNVIGARAIDPDDKIRIRGAIERFAELKLSPRFTFLEAAHIWAIIAHIHIELAREGLVELAAARKAVQQLGQVRMNSDLRAHYLIAKAKLETLFNDKRRLKTADRLCERALELARHHDGIWIRFEALRYQELKKNVVGVSPELRQFADSHGWQGFA